MIYDRNTIVNVISQSQKMFPDVVLEQTHGAEEIDELEFND